MSEREWENNALPTHESQIESLQRLLADKSARIASLEAVVRGVEWAAEDGHLYREGDGMSERRIVVIVCDRQGCEWEVEGNGLRGARQAAKDAGWRVNHSGHDYCPEHVPLYPPTGKETEDG